MRKLIGVLGFLFVSTLSAQPLTVGVHPPDPNSTSTLSSTIAPVSYVNLSDSASATGTVDRASVDWSRACSNAFKVVFLRVNFGNISQYIVVASRGPFNAVAGRNDVPLSPPVAVNTGDLIAVVQLQPFSTCGTVRTMQYADNNGQTLITTSDLSTTGSLGTSTGSGPGYRMSALAYASDPLLVRIVPVAGAAQGAGTFFRTALQLFNFNANTITGKLVFHKAGQSGSASDPSLPFTLPAGGVVSYPDVITAMGTSGVGSLDILTNGGAQPIVAARVFSDGGAAGTSGFSEEALLPADAIDVFRRGMLFTPEDPVNFRMNIGIRTLDSPATVAVTVFDATGTVLGTKSTTYAANYFEQVPFAAFTGISTIPAGGRIVVSCGPYPAAVLVYSSVIDNRTQDSTYRTADIR